MFLFHFHPSILFYCDYTRCIQHLHNTCNTRIKRSVINDVLNDSIDCIEVLRLLNRLRSVLNDSNLIYFTITITSLLFLH